MAPWRLPPLVELRRSVEGALHREEGGAAQAHSRREQSGPPCPCFFPHPGHQETHISVGAHQPEGGAPVLDSPAPPLCLSVSVAGSSSPSPSPQSAPMHAHAGACTPTHARARLSMPDPWQLLEGFGKNLGLHSRVVLLTRDDPLPLRCAQGTPWAHAPSTAALLSATGSTPPSPHSRSPAHPNSPGAPASASPEECGPQSDGSPATQLAASWGCCADATISSSASSAQPQLPAQREGAPAPPPTSPLIITNSLASVTSSTARLLPGPPLAHPMPAAHRSAAPAVPSPPPPRQKDSSPAGLPPGRSHAEERAKANHGHAKDKRRQGTEPGAEGQRAAHHGGALTDRLSGAERAGEGGGGEPRIPQGHAGPPAHSARGLRRRTRKLQEKLRRLAHRHSKFLRLGVSVVHIESGHEAGVHRSTLFPLASVAKLPLLLATLHSCSCRCVCHHKANGGPNGASLDSMQRMEQWDKCIGSGVLKKLPAPLQLPLQHCLQLMHSVSDNSAADLVARVVPSGAVTRFLRGHGLLRSSIHLTQRQAFLIALGNAPDFQGLEGTELARVWASLPMAKRAAIAEATEAACRHLSVEDLRQMEFASEARQKRLGMRGRRHDMAVAAAVDNLGTPGEFSRLLRRLSLGQLLSPAWTQLALAIMRWQEYGSRRIPFFLPKDSSTALHKTGSIMGVINAAGIVSRKERGCSLAIAAFTDCVQRKHEREAEYVIARAANLAYTAYCS